MPEHVVTNQDLTSYMDTTDEWIRERTGIEERRYATKHKESTTSLGAKAARIAIERAGIAPEDIDFINSGHIKPRLLFSRMWSTFARELGVTLKEVGALDIRNQCSGFVYGLSIADQFIKTGMYKNILLVGAEMHSMGLDFSDEGRAVTVIFGDGAGAVVLQPADKEGQGILCTCLHSDGTHAEDELMINPGSHGGYHLGTEKFGYPDPATPGGVFVTQKMMA